MQTISPLLADDVRPVSRAGQPGRVKVLLIEDNLGDARLIEIMLEEEGGLRFELERVDRLDAALRRLDDPDFGLILADLVPS